jgi:hypothetical protein
MPQLTNAHTDFILKVLIEAEQLQRIFPNGEGCLEYVQEMIRDMEMILEISDRVKNHIKFDEIVGAEFGYKDVE